MKEKKRKIPVEFDDAEGFSIDESKLKSIMGKMEANKKDDKGLTPYIIMTFLFTPIGLTLLATRVPIISIFGIGALSIGLMATAVIIWKALEVSI